MGDPNIAAISALQARKGMPALKLEKAEFKCRFFLQFEDLAYASLRADLERIGEAAWDAYANSRKSPKTQKAGPGYTDPDYDLSVDWIAGSESIKAARLSEAQAGQHHRKITHAGAEEHPIRDEVAAGAQGRVPD